MNPGLLQTDSVALGKSVLYAAPLGWGTGQDFSMGALSPNMCNSVT